MKILLLLLLTIPAAAQMSPPGTANLPAYWVGFGAEYNHYASPAAGNGWVTFGTRVAGQNLYSLTTLVMNAKTSSVETGVAYVVAQVGRFSLLARATAGVATGGGNAAGSFTGGGLVHVRLKNQLGVLVGVKAFTSPVTGGLQMAEQIGIGISF